MDKKVIDLIKDTYPKMTEKEKIAFAIAFGAHTGNGQMDYSGLEYINHPLSVYLGCATEDEKIVALLHDTVEDTKITLEDLSLFFDENIIEALRVISHPKKYDKKQYMIDVKNNPLARNVKIQDLKHNMDRSRLESLLEWHDNKVEKQYKHNLAYLLDKEEI